MKFKFTKILIVVLIPAFILGTVGVFRLTSIDIEPRPTSEPTVTMATEGFAVEIPATFKPYLLTYALYWDDGRLIFEEKQGQSKALGDFWASQNIIEINGHVAAWVLELPPESLPGIDQRLGEPLLLEVQVSEKGYLRFYEIIPADALNWDSVVDGTAEKYNSRRAKFLNRVETLLSHYTWGELAEPQTGQYKTANGFITKTGQENFTFSIAQAHFTDDTRHMNLKIDARLSYYDWGGLQLCKADRLTRVWDQFHLTSTSLGRTNCQEIEVGGRQGYELISMKGLGSPQPGSDYTLEWQEDWTKSDTRNYLLNIYLTSPLDQSKSDPPEEVLGQWRAILKSLQALKPEVI